jgi:hypothetical protein
MSSPSLVAALLAVGLARASAAPPEWRNWFADPFFQVSRGYRSCPMPAGPFVDERGRREQAHRRAEKGTTCWLAGDCDRPKAYAYDQDIAEAVRRAFAAEPAFAATTLWVTVQGRVVYIEGCAGTGIAERAEATARAVPMVQQAIAIVRTNPKAAPPYKVLPAQ